MTYLFRPSALIAALTFVLLTAFASHAAETSGVSAQSVSLPSGPGSIEGLGESFEPQLNTGTATFAVNFTLSPGRAGMQPSLGLSYNGGTSNSFVGMGWSLTGLDFIQRQTDKGLPAYDPSDLFVTASGEELVPLSDGSFRAENESSFKRYHFDAGTNTWRAELPDGGELTFGDVSSARVEDGGRSYRWMLTAQEDARGNRVEIAYTSFSGSTNQVYPSRIYYTRHATQSLAGEHIVVMTYAGGRPDPISDFRPSYELTTTHRLVRVDMCTRGGSFTPESVCDDVGEAGAARVRSYRLAYDEVGSCDSLSCTRGLVGSFCTADLQCVAGATRLASVLEVGADNLSMLPELALTYTDYDFSSTAAWSGVIGFPATELSAGEAALADLDADGLPDVLQTPAVEPGVFKRWMNLGVGTGGLVQFASEESFAGPTNQRIGNPGTQLIDLDGDGVADLLTRPDPTGDTFDLFRGTGKGFFELTPEAFQILGVDGFTSSPSGFGSPEVRFVDVDFDKRIDVVRTVALSGDADDLLVRQTMEFETGRGMLPTRSCGAVPDALFQDGKTFLEDLNGDRLLDIVVVEIAAGNDAVEAIRYFPNVGTGGFGVLGSCGQQGLPIAVGGDPVSGLPGADFQGFYQFFWHDLTNDGLGDLVYLGASSVSVWVNRGGSGLFRVDLGAYPNGQTMTLCAPGPGCNPDTVQFTDVNGNSTTDVLFADLETGNVLYLDLAGASGVPAHLLETIDNGLGRVTTIGYEPSTVDYLAASAAGSPWKSRLPFPVTVVAQRSVRFGLDRDGVAGEDDYVTDFRYRDGFYDGVEKEFRGFSEVEAIRRGDAAQATLVTRHSFHTGAPDGIDNDGDGQIDERTVRGGAEEEALKGVSLEVRTETCTGGPAGDCGVTGDSFTHDFSRWEVRTLHGATGKACSLDPIVTCCVNADCAADGLGTCEQQAPAELGTRPELACEVGKSVRWARNTGSRQAVIEQGSAPRIDTLDETDYDDFGNITTLRQWGIVDAPDLPFFGCLLTSGVCSNDSFTECGSDADCTGGTCLKRSHADSAACTTADAFAFTNATGVVDERFETAQYATNEANWQLRCPSETTVTDVNSVEESRARRFYDGLALGQCVQGLATRTEGWLAEEGRFVPQADTSYDVFGNTEEVLDALGNRRSFAQDAAFETFAVSETIHLGSYDLSTTAGHHEGFGRTTFLTDWATTGTGPRSDVVYDTHARVVKRVLPGDTLGSPTTEYSYHLNPGGDGLSWIDAHALETAGGSTLDARTYVDALGRNLATLREADAGDWVVSQLVSYGLASTVRTEWLPFLQPTLSLPALDPAKANEEILRDATGRELQRTLPGGDTTASVYRPLEVEGYDENDTAGVTPGAFVSSRRDGLGRIVSITERESASPHTTSYSYDPNGNLAETIDSQGNTTRWTYDHLGRRTRYEGPNRGSLTAVYDDADRVVETVDARDARVLRSYDAASRATSVTHLPPAVGSGPPTVTYHYDLPAPGPVDWGDGRTGVQTMVAGRVSWIADEAGSDYRSFDERGRVVWQARSLNSADGAEGTYTLHQQHDAMNRLTHLEYPDGDSVHFAYGPRGLLASVVGGDGSGQPLVDSIVYRPNGDVAEMNFSSGARELLDYDARQRRTVMQLLDPVDTPLLDRTIEYDPASNATAILDLRGDVPPATPRHNTRRMQYDDLHRLTRFTIGSSSDAGFDAGHLDFSYDAIGNRLTRASTIASDPGFSSGVSVLYNYAGGRSGRNPRQPAEAPGPHALTSDASGALTYDDNGNVTSYDDVAATWDAVDRLVQLASPSFASDYVYDHSGRRVVRSAQWLTASETRRAGERSETLYPHSEFEVRDGESVKVVFVGSRRLAEVTGTLDPSALRVQRIELRTGWNLVSLAVDAADAAGQLGVGDAPALPAWLWDATRREYVPVTNTTPLPQGSILWVDADQGSVVALRGSYAPATTIEIGASSAPAGNPALGALPLASLAGNATLAGYDAYAQNWRLALSQGGLQLDELPQRLPPGAALFVKQDVARSITVPTESARTRLFHTGFTGSVSATTDGAGALVEETAYLPFGGVRLRTPGSDAGLARSPYAFIGRERDEESGLTQIEARYMENPRGRFLSVDPALVEMGATTEPRRRNAYAYGLNNPFRYSDTNGRDARSLQETARRINQPVIAAVQDGLRNQLRGREVVAATRATLGQTGKRLVNLLYTPTQQRRIRNNFGQASAARTRLNELKGQQADNQRKLGGLREQLRDKKAEFEDVFDRAAAALEETERFKPVVDFKEDEGGHSYGGTRTAVKFFRELTERKDAGISGNQQVAAEALRLIRGVEIVKQRVEDGSKAIEAQQRQVDLEDQLVTNAVVQPLLTSSSGGGAAASGGGD